MKKSQHVQPGKNYYTPYFFYNDYFKCLTSFERLVISFCGLQDYVHSIYTLDQDDRARSSHTSPIRAGSSLLYELFYYRFNYFYYNMPYFKTLNRDLGAYSLQKTGQLAHPQLGISESTKT